MRSTYGMKKPGSMGKTASPVKPPTPGALPAASTRPPAPGVNPIPNPNSGMGNQGGPPPTPVYSNQTSGIAPPLNGVGGQNLYDTMAQQDMEAAQRDRDVSRAASMREMREGAISQGIGPGTQRYQAMARDAEAGANQYGQQSRNAAANRAQGLMMDKKEDQEEQTNNYVNTLSENEQRAFLDLRASGMNDIDALKTMKGMDIKQNSALDDKVRLQVDQRMAFTGESEEVATAAVMAENKTNWEADRKPEVDRAQRDAMVPEIKAHLGQIEQVIEDMGTQGGIAKKYGKEQVANTALGQWSDEQWIAAEENNLVPLNLLKDAPSIGSDSTTLKWRNLRLQEGQFRKWGGVVYRVDSFTNSYGTKGNHKGGQILMTAMTGPRAGEGGIDYLKEKKGGSI